MFQFPILYLAFPVLTFFSAPVLIKCSFSSSPAVRSSWTSWCNSGLLGGLHSDGCEALMGVETSELAGAAQLSNKAAETWSVSVINTMLLSRVLSCFSFFPLKQKADPL